MPRARSNGEGNIRLRSDGRWEIRITTDVDFMTGQVKRISRYANTREEAITLLHELSIAYNSNPNLKEHVTLKAWMQTWLNVYMQRSIKQSTYLSYEGYLRNHFSPVLGDVLLQDLSPRLLQQFFNYKQEHENLSAKTIVNMNLCLHKCLDHACKEGYILSNPASSINLPRGERPQIEILSRDEQGRLVQASYQHRYGIFIRLTLVTGLRIGELLGLRWEDVDYTAGLLYVRRTLNRLNKVNLPAGYTGPRTEIVIQEPKSKNSIRTIPLLPAVLQELSFWRNSQQSDKQLAGDQYSDSGMLVTNPFGGYVEPRTFKDYYNQIITSAGLRHFTFHALRHTFASRAMEQGMDSKTLSVLLGHASVSFTLDTYTHVLTDYKREGMQLMETLYNLAPAELPGSNLLYPVIVTAGENGAYTLTAPDFPSLRFTAPTLEYGLQTIPELLQEEISGFVYPPSPTPVNQLSLEPGAFLLQLAPAH